MNLAGLRERWVVGPSPDGPDLRVVAERSGHSTGTYLVALAMSLLFLVLFGLAVFHTVLIGAQDQLDGLDARIEAEQDRQHRLRLRLAELESPERIVEVATGDLGMVAPDEVVWLSPVEGTTPPADDGRPAGGPSDAEVDGGGSEVAGPVAGTPTTADRSGDEDGSGSAAEGGSGGGR